MCTAVLIINDEAPLHPEEPYWSKFIVYKGNHQCQTVAIKVRNATSRTRGHYVRTYGGERDDDDGEEIHEVQDQIEQVDSSRLAQLQSLRHEHIASFIGMFTVSVLGEHHNGCLVFEYAAGGTLERALSGDLYGDDEGTFAGGASHGIIYQIASGLDYLHEHNTVHGNLKPSNVMFKDVTRGRVVITDFGLPRQYRTENATATLYQPTDESNTRASDVFGLATIALSVVQGRMLQKRPTIDELKTDRYLAGLVMHHPSSFAILIRGLFQNAHSRPTASEFKDSFRSRINFS